LQIHTLFRHRLVKDSLVLLGVQITGYVLPLVTLPYLTRVLGPANFGLMALGTALALYFYVITEYGFAVTGTRQIAIVQDDIEQVSRTYSAIMACKLSLLAACFLTLSALVLLVPQLRLHWALYFISFLQVIGWCLSPSWLFQGMQRIRLVAYSDYGAKLVSVGLIFLLVHKQSDYLMAAALQSGGFLVSAVIGLILVFAVLQVRPVQPSISEMREAMVQGWRVFLSMASLTVISSSNTVILGLMTAPDQVGFFSAASRLIIAARALTNPVTTAVYPHISRLAARSRSEAVRMLRKQLFWTAAPFLFISIGMAFFSPLAARILYGKAYVETGILLQIMSMTPFVHAVSMCFGTYYMLAFGYQKQWSTIIIRMVVLNFIVLFALMVVMRPVRAVALTTTLMDVYAATSCTLFYKRTVNTAAAPADAVAG